MAKLTQGKLKELLDYNPETGVFTWKVNRGRTAKAGDIAGNINYQGYQRIRIYSKSYLSHRLAWLWIEGYFPENEIDHINRNKSDNRFKNLRHVSNVCNARNSGIQKNNTSKVTGVSWNKVSGKWEANIRILGKRIYLGLFNSLLNAAKARWESEVKYNFTNCNTTSSAFQYVQKNGIGS